MPNTPAAAPAVSSTVGLKNMVIAPVTADTETATTYGDLQRVAGAIEATITPENNDPDIQFFDDVEGDVLYPDPELTFKTKLADLPLIVQEMIFSNKIDDNGVLIRTANDKPGYFAVGFMSEKANGTYRYVWLFKVRAKPVTESWFCILFQNQFTPDDVLDNYPVDRLMHDIALALMAVQAQTTDVLSDFPTTAATEPAQTPES